MAGQTISSDCDPPPGGDHPAKKTIAPDTAPPPSHAEKKFPVSGPVNMLTGCPGHFLRFFIFIIQFVVRKKMLTGFFQQMLTRQQLTFAA